MIRLISAMLTLLLFAVPLMAQTIQADIYIDMETGVDGQVLTVPLLAAATHVACANWTLEVNPLTTFKVDEGNDHQLPFPVTVAGVDYSTAGTRSFDYDHAGPTKERALCHFAPYKPRVSAGMFLNPGGDTVSGRWDHLNISGYQTGCVVQVWKAIGQPSVILAHSKVGYASYGGVGIGIDATSTYWVTMLFDSVAGTCDVEVYRTDDWTQVGPTSTSPTKVGSPAKYILVGIDGHNAVKTPTHSYNDDLLIDFTNAAFPLGILP